MRSAGITRGLETNMTSGCEASGRLPCFDPERAFASEMKN